MTKCRVNAVWGLMTVIVGCVACELGAIVVARQRLCCCMMGISCVWWWCVRGNVNLFFFCCFMITANVKKLYVD